MDEGRLHLAEKALDGEIQYDKFGKKCALIFIVLVLGVITIAIIYDKPWTSGLLST